MFIILILLAPAVFALKGAGIKWAASSEIIEEGSTKCISYGIYNPWDEDISISLGAVGEIAQFADILELKPRFVKAKTSNENAVWQEMCFTPKKVTGCSTGQIISFKGEVVAKPTIEQQAAGSGSITATSAAAPLEISVKCGAKAISINLIVWGIIVAIILIIVLIILLIKKKKEKSKKILNKFR